MGLFGAIGKGLSRIGGLASKLAPAVGLIPGVGTIAGAGLGLGGALLSGEGLGTGLKRGLIGGLGAGGLSKIGGLVGQGAFASKAAGKGIDIGQSLSSRIAALAGQVLGGANTGENVRRLVTEVGLPIAGGIDRRLSRGRRESESDALDAFFRSIDRGETERISSTRERFGLGSGALN